MQETFIESFRLSPQQRHLCALVHEEQSFPYRTHITVRLEGLLDVARLSHAMRKLVERYEILRTNFPRLAGFTLPAQVINSEVPLLLEVHDCSFLSSEQQNETLAKIQETIRTRPFDLAEGPAWRVILVQGGTECHWLLWDMAALNVDIQACHVLLRELSRWYSEEGGDQEEEPLQYADLSEWQYEMLESEETAAGREYWRAYEHALQSAASLPFEHSVDPRAPFSPQACSLELSPVLSIRLEELAQQLKVSQSSILLACWGIVLARLTGLPKQLIGTGCDGRKYAEVAEAVGLFAKSLPLWYQFEENTRCSELLRLVEKTVHEGLEWQEYFSWQWLEGLKEGEEPFCPFGFDYEVLPLPWDAGGLKWAIQEQEIDSDRFIVCLSCLSSSQSLRATLRYDQGVFSKEEIQRVLKHWQTALEQVLADPDALLQTLQLLTQEERHQILHEWNATQSDLPAAQAIHQLFEEQVDSTPDAIAVVEEGEHLSYLALDQQANQLADALRRKGVGPEVCVGLCIPRSTALIIAILSVLKASGAYVPLDVTCPAERLAFIMQDAAISLLLTQEEVLSKLAHPEVEKRARLPWLGTEQSLTYIIYTSGSTGQPKGVMITHRGLVNYLHWARQTYASSQARGTLLHSPISFDLTVTSLFVPLLTGQSVEVLSEEQGLEALAEKMRSQPHWSLLKLTPAHLDVLNSMELGQELEGVTEALILGGEALWYRTLSRWQQYAPYCRLINEYGPTETVVGCSVYEAPAHMPEQARVPIGRPIANTQLYILDSHLQPVLIGQTGELYIGGHGVARAYLHHADLTAAHFIPDPFSLEPGARLYKTSDLARYLPDGNIEFLGRNDHQVKMRGFRIELGEIEAVLCQHPAIRECVVLLREDVPGDKRLAAYLTTKQQPSPTTDELLRYLQNKLPEYMQPSVFVHMETLPLTSNGKVDRQALPAPNTLRRKEALAPRTPTEEILVALWQQVLHLDQIGVEDNFFKLGGHSLLATQLIALIRSLLHIEVPLSSLFEAPTIAQQAQQVEQALRSGEGVVAPPLRAMPRTQELPLSFAQQRLWIVDQLEPGNIAYLVPDALKLRGPVHSRALELSLQEAIRRHEILRTTFEEHNGQPVQRIASAGAYRLPLIDLRDLGSQERQEEAHRLIALEERRPFNLASGPLMRTYLLQLAPDEHVLLLTLHHIITDGWSNIILRRELRHLYDAFVAGKSSSLAPLPIQYADYALWQRNWLQGEVLQSLLDYWKKQLAGSTPLRLPTNYPRPEILSYRGAACSFGLSPELSASIIALSHQENVTLFMTLLAAFQVLLYRYTGQTDIVVGTDIANRTHAETEALIGFFVNLLVLRSNLSNIPTFQEVLGCVRQTVLEAYAHQDAPFEMLVEQLLPGSTFNRVPLVQALFVLLNIPEEDAPPPELVQVAFYDAETTTAKFELALFLLESPKGLRGTVVYNSELFEARSIARMMGRFEVLLQSIITNPGTPIDVLDFYTEEEKRQQMQKEKKSIHKLASAKAQEIS